MHLPKFSANHSLLSDTVELVDFFNPFVSKSWELWAPSTPANGRVAIPIYMKVLRAFASDRNRIRELVMTDDNATSLLECGLRSQVMVSVREQMFDFLPEHLKWAVYMMQVGYVSSSQQRNWVANNPCAMPVNIYIPSGIDEEYGEFTYARTQDGNTLDCMVEFKYTLSGSTPTIVPDSIKIRSEPAVKARIQHHAQAWVDWCNEHETKRVNPFDGPHPRLITNMLKFMHNMECCIIVSATGTANATMVKPNALVELWNRTKERDPGAAILFNTSSIPNPVVPMYGINVYTHILTTVVHRIDLHKNFGYNQNVLDVLKYRIEDRPVRTFGVELEVSTDLTPQQLIEAQKELFFICKDDSSIRGSKLYKSELVTVPATLKAHKRLWASFFDSVDYDKFDTTADTGNGMHIHVSCLRMKPSTIEKMMWFMCRPENQDFLFQISERPERKQYDQWAKTPLFSNYKSRYIAQKDVYRQVTAMRGALNYKKMANTLEFRIFKGFFSYATVVKNLEFADSVCEFVIEANKNQLLPLDYLNWLNKQPNNRYSTLKTFMNEQDFKQAIISSQLRQLLWNGYAQSTQQVYDKLKKAPFAITQDHITLLNKVRKKRVFVLKNGKLECLSLSGAKLSGMDKVLAERLSRGSATFALKHY
jgi:hypothetical protein